MRKEAWRNAVSKNACIENEQMLQRHTDSDGNSRPSPRGFEAAGGGRSDDLGGKLVLPPFVESHVHLTLIDGG